MAPAPEEGAGAISFRHQPQMTEPHPGPAAGRLLASPPATIRGDRLQEIFNLDEGSLCSHIQRRIRPKVTQDLADYLELFLKAKRRAGKEAAANRGGAT